ncbi:MAG: NAD(P)/FAD-dependent oxidoreductase [Candidatus Methylomirabilis oxyfera]|nr:NAD(P)/FAD-dependent oxidoreductase [Candidatus Methylomirabilis oxyfera]
MPEPNDLHDITIIGGGPTGLFAAYYARFRGLTAKIIDSLPELGGQLTAAYPEKYIYDVAGFPKILAKDLVRNLVEQAMAYSPTVCLGERVQKLEPSGEKRLRVLTDRAEHWTRALIITTGLGMYTPRRLRGSELFEGKGLYYTVTRTDEFRGRELLIIGGGDSAVDWALHLEPVASGITLIHRRDQFRAHEENVRQLVNSTVRVKLSYKPKELRGEARVREVVIVNTKTKAEEILLVDAVLACLGFSSELGPMADWGLELEGNEAFQVNTRMETNIPGVYAAGDVAAFPGKVKLIATGFGEAVTAVNNAAHYLDPGMKVFPGYSTTIMKRRERKAQNKQITP